MSTKQKKALETIEWFIPTHCDWTSPETMLSDSEIGVLGIIEDSAGLGAEEAFFEKTERGVLPEKVNDVPRLRALLWGQRRVAMHEKMWREEAESYDYPIRFAIMSSMIEDFKSEPEGVQKILKRALKLK